MEVEKVNADLTIAEAAAVQQMRENPTNMFPKMSTAGKYSEVSKTVHEKFDIVYVRNLDSYFYIKPGEKSYRPLSTHDLERIAKEAYESSFGPALPRNIKDCADMIRRNTRYEFESTHNGMMQVSDWSFWSAGAGKLLRERPNIPSFKKLFSTKYPDKHVVAVDPFTEVQDNKMHETYKEVLEELERGEFNERYEFISTWADGNHDVYVDIMKSIASCFLKKKPVGSYILVGLRRNGKSSFVGLLHTIFGRDNTSMVRLSQIGDHHHSHSLLNTMMNAPDEEDDGALNFQADFKVIADHGVLSLPVLFSNQPIQLVSDFMCFYPMNHIPEWKGTGAAACMKRSLVIPFYADLSEFDQKNYNFAEETFTADMMCDFMGSVFAYATYYTNHEMAFSSTMEMEQQSMEEDVDSAVTYYNEFREYFDGFENMTLLYSDYCNWCKARDTRISKRKEFKFVFRKYLSCRSKVTINKSGGVTNAYRIPETGKLCLWKGLDCGSPVGTVARAQELEYSIVERMTMYGSNIKTDLWGNGGAK